MPMFSKVRFSRRVMVKVRNKSGGLTPKLIEELTDVEGAEEISGLRIGNRIFPYAIIEYMDIAEGSPGKKRQT